MNSFIYEIPTKVYFGENQLGNLGGELKKYGDKVLLVYGGGSIKKSGLYGKIAQEIAKSGLKLYELSGVEPNPKVTSVNKGAKLCREEKIDVLLAVGGGSVIDAAKAIGAAAFYDGDAWDLVTQKAPIKNVLPVLTILTLAATGSEMDPFSVISNMETKDKLGCRHPGMLPKVSFLDPSNTYSVSAYQTACGAADIISHILESYFNMTPGLFMLDRIAEDLLKTVIKYAPIAIREPDNYEARANLMWASSWAINGFIDGGRHLAWSCHAIEHELSAIYDITHGHGLAILMPRWMEYTLDETTVSRFRQFGHEVFGLDENNDMLVARESIYMLSDFLLGRLELQNNLSDIGIDKTNFGIIAEKACKGGVLQGFKPLNQKDIENILNMCL